MKQKKTKPQCTGGNFTAKELELFQRRYDNGYDLTNDDRYNQWLSLSLSTEQYSDVEKMTDKIGSSATADKKRKAGSAMPAKKGARSNIIAKNPGKGADTKTMANKDPASPMKASAVTRKGVRAMAGKDLAPTKKASAVISDDQARKGVRAMAGKDPVPMKRASAVTRKTQTRKGVRAIGKDPAKSVSGLIKDLNAVHKDSEATRYSMRSKALTATISHPEKAIGKWVKMKFEIDDTGASEWFEGIISFYDERSKKYAIFFPCDKETIFTALDDEDIKFI